jgi:hypothetical protein
MIKFSRPSTKQLPGRRPANVDLSPAQIKAEAARLLTIGISHETWRVLDWLSVGGIMSVAQLQLRPRTLRKYAQARLIDRYPLPIKKIAQEFERYSLPFTEITDTQLYVLGPVGLEILNGRHTFTPLSGHLSYPLSRIMHDVILNEIVLRLITFAEGLGWEALWMGTSSAMLFNEEKMKEILEPDALLVFEHAGQKHWFCIEYHNEDHQARAEHKVSKYQAAYETGEWRIQWETETFPTVLAIFEKKIVGLGYQTALRDRKTNVTFCGKLLAGVLQNNLAEWTNFATGEKNLLLEQMAGEIFPLQKPTRSIA